MRWGEERSSPIELEGGPARHAAPLAGTRDPGTALRTIPRHPAFRLAHLPVVFPARARSTREQANAVVLQPLSETAQSVTEAGSSRLRTLIEGIDGYLQRQRRRRFFGDRRLVKEELPLARIDRP